MKLDRKQDLNVLYQVDVFRADRKNKMAALASDWLRHFRLFWNCWTEFKETWQDARSQRPLATVCFSGRMVNKNVHLGRFLKKVAHCTQVHDMWPFGPLVFQADRKTRWLPWRLIGWDIFDSLLKPLNKIQRNLTGSKISTYFPKFVFFRPMSKQ